MLIVYKYFRFETFHKATTKISKGNSNTVSLKLKVGGQPRQMYVEIMKKELLALMLPKPENKQTTTHNKHWLIKPKWPKRPRPKLNPHQIGLITHLVLGYAFPLFHLCHHRWDIVCTWYEKLIMF